MCSDTVLFVDDGTQVARGEPAGSSSPAGLAALQWPLLPSTTPVTLPAHAFSFAETPVSPVNDQRDWDRAGHKRVTAKPAILTLEGCSSPALQPLVSPQRSPSLVLLSVRTTPVLPRVVPRRPQSATVRRGNPTGPQDSGAGASLAQLRASHSSRASADVSHLLDSPLLQYAPEDIERHVTGRFSMQSPPLLSSRARAEEHQPEHKGCHEKVRELLLLWR